MNQMPNPKTRLVQFHLAEAQKALVADKLPEAGKHFEEALGVEGEHPDRAPDIRQVLQKYCEQAAGSPNPNWPAVHQALALIETLGLQNEETRAYHHQLNLKEAEFLLAQQDDLDGSFVIFSELMNNAGRLGGQEKLKQRIAQIVCEYVPVRAAQQQWSLLNRVFERVQALWPEADSVQDWLEAVSRILEAAHGAQAAHSRERADLEKRVTDQREQIEQLRRELNSLTQLRDQLQTEVNNLSRTRDALQSDAGQAQRRAQTLTYALIGLLILAVLMYPLALLLP